MAPPPPPSTNVWIAASEGNLSLVQEFFEADSSLKPTSPDDNTYTPLHAAASYAHHDLLRWLLTHPRATPDDVNVADEDGDTPLFVVEDAATARLLIEEFSADAKHRNNEGLTAAATMHENGFDDAAEYVRSVTGEQLESVQEEDEDEDDDSASQSDDLQHDGETTKRYVDLLKEYTSCEVSRRVESVHVRGRRAEADTHCHPHLLATVCDHVHFSLLLLLLLFRSPRLLFCLSPRSLAPA